MLYNNNDNDNSERDGRLLHCIPPPPQVGGGPMACPALPSDCHVAIQSQGWPQLDTMRLHFKTAAITVLNTQQQTSHVMIGKQERDAMR